MSGAKPWTEAEKEIVRNMRVGGCSVAEIAASLPGRSESAIHHQLYVMFGPRTKYQRREVDRVGDTPRAGKRKCLSCRSEFHSPDKRQIHICDPCKETELYRGAA